MAQARMIGPTTRGIDDHLGVASSPSDQKYSKLRKIVGHDPLPYGMAANLKTIEALSSTAFQQKLTPRQMEVAELFVDPEKSGETRAKA
jgi:hypothetical protein